MRTIFSGNYQLDNYVDLLDPLVSFKFRDIYVDRLDLLVSYNYLILLLQATIFIVFMSVLFSSRIERSLSFLFVIHIYSFNVSSFVGNF